MLIYEDKYMIFDNFSVNEKLYILERCLSL